MEGYIRKKGYLFCQIVPPSFNIVIGPAHYQGISSSIPVIPMVVITDRQSTNKDVPFMRPRAVHQLHIWKHVLREDALLLKV